MVTSSPTRKLVRCERHRLVTSTAVGAVVLVLEGDAVARRTRSAGCWRWRRGGYSATDRQAPPRVRRTGLAVDDTTCACAAAPGRRRRPCARRGGHDCRRTAVGRPAWAASSFSSIRPRNSCESTAHRQEKARPAATPNVSRRARCRRLARSCARAGDASWPSPRCAAPR